MNEQDETPVSSTLDAVRQAALDLLDALPVRPERLRVSAADVVVSLDWRPPAAARQQVRLAASEVVEGPMAEAAVPVAEVPAPAPERTDVHYICAPSVGTFYVSPEPGAVAFAPEGTVVSSGQQVAIVEAMKLMLPVEADRTGRVVEVLVADGQPVEYGERLLALAPVG